MLDQSAAIAAAVRAVRGESDLDAVLPALADAGLARVIACAPETHHLVRAIAALRGGLPSLLDAPTRADPALHAAMAHVIGTPAGRAALRSWAAMAPAGWGRAHAVALIDAVHAGVCDPGVVAALIGPNDTVAGLLRDAWDVAFAIRNWGQANAAPDAWAAALAPAERDRLITALQREPLEVASCLPWLPPDVARAESRTCSVNIALEAFADASPPARRLHAAIVPHLVARTRPGDLDALTRLACATGEKAVWTRVQTLIQESPGDAWRVVAAAPWDALPDDVRNAIVERADKSDACAAVAAARGQRDPVAMGITEESATAFFATLNPAVWDAIDPAVQQRLLLALPPGRMSLAVRALGLRPDILAQATLDDALVQAAQRHAPNEDAWRAALLSVAMHYLPLNDAHDLIAAMPLPPDSGAFFCVASRHGDPKVIASARSVLRTPDALALAVVLQGSANGSVAIRDRTAALQHALRGWTWNDLPSIVALLPVDIRIDLMPNAAALAGELAHPSHQDALRRALDRLAALPPEVAIPTTFALRRRNYWNVRDTAATVATALRAHGDVFLALADAVTNNDLRDALLPLPEDAAHADALRVLARDDPPTAQRLAYAHRTRSWRDALLAQLHASPRHAAAVWQALDDAMRQAICTAFTAAPPHVTSLAERDPIAALALAALHAEDDDIRTAGVAALAQRTETLRALWGTLPPEVQQTLRAHLAVADLQPLAETPAIRSRGNIRRRS